MNFSKSAAGRPQKGQLKCNLCRKPCPAKSGDWFISPDSPNQQIFLCKECESGAKGAYRKASLPTPNRP